MGATRTTAMIMLILGGAAFMSAAMAYTRIPAAIADGVASLDLGPSMLIACLTIFYIILGMFLDGISMIVLTMAIVLPLVQKAGFDLIWFGIFVVLVVEMAQVSPPVGFNLFVLQSMSGRDSWTVALAALPFFILLIVAVAIITVFPSIALFLPRLVFPA
jgi:TRAP-type C4-dicarboxylate transport system permease large subunit